MIDMDTFERQTRFTITLESIFLLHHVNDVNDHDMLDPLLRIQTLHIQTMDFGLPAVPMSSIPSAPSSSTTRRLKIRSLLLIDDDDVTTAVRPIDTGGLPVASTSSSSSSTHLHACAWKGHLDQPLSPHAREAPAASLLLQPDNARSANDLAMIRSSHGHVYTYDYGALLDGNGLAS